jgi:hypothetical protein
MLANRHTSFDSAPLFTPDCGRPPNQPDILQFDAQRVGASGANTPIANR